MKFKFTRLLSSLFLGFALFVFTPTVSATSESFSFTAAGDYGASSDARKVTELIKTLDPDFHLALGDLSYDQLSESRWCDFVKSGAGSVPFLLLTGNHESDGHEGDFSKFAQCLPFNLDANLSGIYPEEYYFDYPKVNPVARFIITPPDLTFKKDGRTYTYNYSREGAGFKNTERLIRDAKSKNLQTIVGMHKVCISTGDKPCEIGADFANMLISEGVDLVVAGHVHSYERTYPLKCMRVNPTTAQVTSCLGSTDRSSYNSAQGTVFATIGTGGRPILSQSNSDRESGYFASRYGSNNPHYGVVKFTVNNEKVSAEFVDARTGAILDSFNINKSAVAPALPVAPPAHVTVTSQTTNQTYAINSGTKRVTFSTNDIPAGAQAVVSLEGGPTTGVLNYGPASAGFVDVDLTAVKNGDSFTNTLPGNYRFKVSLYQRVVSTGCTLSTCGPQGFIFSDESDGTITLTSGVVNPSSPAITSIQPSSGQVGSTVTLRGTGFTATGNRLKFGNMGTEDSPSYNLNSLNNELTFTVPSSNYMSCWSANPACMAHSYPTPLGSHRVSVINANGTSNEFSFTVTGSANTGSPTISYVQARAEDRNILHPNETSTVYGNNLIGVNVFYVDSLGISRQFETANPYNTSIDILTPYVGSIPEGSYSLFAEKNGVQSNKINFSYVNPTDHHGASLTVRRPANGQTYNMTRRRPGHLNVTWNRYTGDFEGYYVMLGNSKLQMGTTLTPDRIVSRRSTTLSVSAQTVQRVIEELLDNNPGFSMDDIKDDFYIEVMAQRDGRTVASAKGRNFTILNNDPSITERGAICRNLEMVWKLNRSEIRREAYTYETDSCDGYRYLDGHEISPSCYNEQECREIGGRGKCVDVGKSKSVCSSQHSLPLITVTYPNGGETWQVGSTQTVTFNPSNIYIIGKKLSVVLVNLDTTSEYHLTKDDIIAESIEKQAVNILVPNVPAGNHYRVRISNCENGDCSIQDVSDNYFSITSGPISSYPVSVSVPSSVIVGSTYNITWSGDFITLSPGSVTPSTSVYLVKPNGVETYLGASTGTARSFSWVIPSNLSGFSGLKIKLVRSGVTVGMSNQFSVNQNTTSTKRVTLTMSNTSFTKTGGNFNIPFSWTSNFPFIKVWAQIIDSNGVIKNARGKTFTGGSQGEAFDIIFADYPAGNYVLKFCDVTDGGVTANSICDTKTFTVVNQSTTDAERFVTVTSPNSGGSYTVGERMEVRWSYRGFQSDQKVTVALFKNGSHLTNIATNVPITDGRYGWTIPSGTYESGAIYKVYVGAVSVTGTRTDYSDTSFSISSLPARIISPTSGTTFTRGAWYTISWENAPLNSGDLELFLVDVGGSQTRIATVPGTSRSYQWTVPANLDPSSSYKIRLYNSGQMIAITDYFSIIRYVGETVANKTLTVTVPTTSFTKTSWTESFQIPYSWSGSYSMDRAWFQLIDSNGVIKNAGGAGSFVFGSGATSRTLTFPADAGTGTYTLKVCDTTISSVSANSICGTKTIQINADEKTVRVLAPNGGQVYSVGDTIDIDWTYTGFPESQRVTIALFKNGSHFKNIATNVPITNESTTWVIPSGEVYDSGAIYKIYVGAVDINGTRTDYSDSAFTINPVSASPQSSSKEDQIANIQAALQILLQQLKESLGQ